MTFTEFNKLILLKDIVLLGIAAILGAILFVLNKGEKRKRLKKENFETEFEKFCSDIPEIQNLLKLRDLYLEEFMTLYTDLSSIQTVYNFVVDFKKSCPLDYYPTELNKIEQYLDKRYKNLYIQFQKSKDSLNKYQTALTECYEELKILFIEEGGFDIENSNKEND